MSKSDRNKKRGEANRKRRRELRQNLGLGPGWKVKRDKIKETEQEGKKIKVYNLVLTTYPLGYQRDDWIWEIIEVLGLSGSEVEDKFQTVRFGKEVTLASSPSGEQVVLWRDKLALRIGKNSLEIREEF